jgi:hypothetical protein
VVELSRATAVRNEKAAYLFEGEAMSTNTLSSKQLAKIESLLTPMGIRREHVDLTGDLVTASLLSQIIYWHKLTDDGQLRMGVCKDGVYWIAKTKAAWMTETRLTEWEFRSALAQLQSMGLVECRVWKFANIRQLHVRLVHERYFELRSKALESVSHHDKTSVSIMTKCQSPTCQNVSFQHDISSLPYTKTTEEITEEITPGSPYGEAALGETEEGQLPTLAQKLEEQKNKKDTKAIEVWSKNLPAWWKALVAAKSGKKARNLGGKEMGQIAHIKRELGDPVLTASVMMYAVWNWATFVNRVRALVGTGQAPSQPRLDYLLMHIYVARDMYKESISPRVKTPVQMVKEFVPVAYNEPKKIEAPTGTLEEAFADYIAYELEQASRIEPWLVWIRSNTRTSSRTVSTCCRHQTHTCKRDRG